MQIQESIYGGRADDIYGAPLPVLSIYRSYVVGSAIILGPLGAWQLPARYASRSTAFVPHHVDRTYVKVADTVTFNRS